MTAVPFLSPTYSVAMGSSPKTFAFVHWQHLSVSKSPVRERAGDGRCHTALLEAVSLMEKVSSGHPGLSPAPALHGLGKSEQGCRNNSY